jgi:rubrerythrin
MTMPDELSEVLDSAIYKEIASQAAYEAAQGKTDDPGVRELLQELARQEVGHAEKLKSLKEKGRVTRWHRERVPVLKMDEYLTGGDTLEGAGMQDTLIFAIKREQQSIDFYSRMMGMMSDQAAKELCANLVNEELHHKRRLEILYDDLFFQED